MRLKADQLNRARGVLLGQASGDALGAPYEFRMPLPENRVPVMGRGALGDFEPGQYTDDTEMAVRVAFPAAAGADLRRRAGLDAVAAGFLAWIARDATDVGAQTSGVLGATRHALKDYPDASPADVMARTASVFHAKTGRSGGNGSLMRTSPVALRYLRSRRKAADAARKVSALTHYDPNAGDACAIWGELIRLAVLTGQLQPKRALRAVPRARRGFWAEKLHEAEHATPDTFPNNGWVVTAFQAAYSAVTRAEGTSHKAAFVDGLERAVRAGNDTDTVAAIAGGLLGALYGADAIPAWWPVRKLDQLTVNQRVTVHGHPGVNADRLLRLAEDIAAHA